MIKFFKILPETNIDFIGMRKIFFTLSAVLMLACLGSIFVKGMNYGIDFTGGTLTQVQFSGDINIAQIRTALNSEGLNADIQTFVGKNAFSIRIKGAQQDVNETADKIEAALTATNVPFKVEQRDFVGPTVGSNSAKRAIFAFAIAMAAMIIYVGFRFQNIVWGAMAVVALVHDVLFTVGICAILGIEIDQVMLAAFMTIAGYSLNDTIVIFDRARENMKLHPKMGLKELLNLSVNETLSRTFITSFTVLVATGVIFVFGGQVLRDFSFAMLLGLISGIYSTVGLVTCLVYEWTKNNVNGQPGAVPAVAEGPQGFTQPKKKNKKRYN